MSKVWFGIGSNRDRAHNIRAGVKALHDAFAGPQTPLHISRVFESEAVGFVGHSFYNLVAWVETTVPLLDVLARCKAIERQHGHDSRAPRFSPRTLDIDILLYDDEVCSTPIQLPRAEILTNAFVLWPLAELSAEQCHPVLKKTYAELWQSYAGQQQLAPIALEFESLPYLVSPLNV